MFSLPDIPTFVLSAVKASYTGCWVVQGMKVLTEASWIIRVLSFKSKTDITKYAGNMSMNLKNSYNMD